MQRTIKLWNMIRCTVQIKDFRLQTIAFQIYIIESKFINLCLWIINSNLMIYSFWSDFVSFNKIK